MIATEPSLPIARGDALERSHSVNSTTPALSGNPHDESTVNINRDPEQHDASPQQCQSHMAPTAVSEAEERVVASPPTECADLLGLDASAATMAGTVPAEATASAPDEEVMHTFDPYAPPQHKDVATKTASFESARLGAA